MARLLIVANRLPVSVTLSKEGVRISATSGGLATGLSGPHKRLDSLWLGWPGELPGTSPELVRKVESRLSELRLAPVYLTEEEVRRYYHGFSNRVLWPLYHYLVDKLPLDLGGDWPLYVQANRKFAEAVAKHYRTGDIVWVQDYQLSLVPGMLRELVPDAKIGFFLHIPFPSSDIFRLLPWGRQILEGLLGADLLGFHTFGYARHFGRSLTAVLGLDVTDGEACWEGRRVKLGAFPLGVDFTGFQALASDPDVESAVQKIRRDLGDRKLFLGVDRLDYTKGLPRRMAALQSLFEQDPALRERVRCIQVAVPSRTKIETYATMRRRLDELVGRINGEFGSISSVPIHYLYRSISPQQLVALYRSADLMLVTPLRDGMNLVAKEFVASRADGDGILVISELAGAATELVEAVRINPYDREGMVQAIRGAMAMPAEERRLRMQALRRRVQAYDCFRWAEDFLKALSERPSCQAELQPFSPQQEIERLSQNLRQASGLVLLLDYDGTLVPFSSAPWMARPDEPLISLLGKLCSRPNTSLHLVSGRARETMQSWFGGLPLGLHAEHGYWSRPEPPAPWRSAATEPPEWKRKVLEVIKGFAETTPGAFVEEKTAGLAWHYRMADPVLGAMRSAELCDSLGGVLNGLPADTLRGAKVIEVRARGVHKGLVVARALEKAPPDWAVLAMGDDATDEDLFASLPRRGHSVHVGRGPSVARLRLKDPAAARAFLASLLS